MRTTLPTLSYNPTGFEWSEDIHRSAYTRGRALPRTDLEHFNPWGTFTTEINDAITARMLAMNIPFGAEYDVGSLPTKQRVVDNEEAVRHEAIVQLHNLVEDVLSILGIQGRLALSVSGNSQIIGEPDFSWLRANTKHPKVVVRVSMISVFDRPHLWDRQSTRQNGRPLFRTCLRIFNVELVTSLGGSDSLSTLSSSSMAT